MKIDKKDIKIEQGTLKDLEQCIKFALRIPKENLFENDIITNVDKGAEVLARLLDNGTKDGCIILAKWKGFVIGMLALGEADLWWSDRRYMTNLVFYVHPNFRKLGIQKSLLAVASAMGVPFVFDYFSFKGDNDIIRRYMKMQGFKDLGFKMIK